MRVGDVAHVFVLLNTIAFMVAVLMHALGFANFFAASFQSEGFCITNKDKSFSVAGLTLPATSHELCFYSDAGALLPFTLDLTERLYLLNSPASLSISRAYTLLYSAYPNREFR